MVTGNRFNVEVLVSGWRTEPTRHLGAALVYSLRGRSARVSRLFAAYVSSWGAGDALAS